MAKSGQTKSETVRAMLARPEGASLEAICAATGWQAHSVRAALSGLRKAGHPVVRGPAHDGETAGSVYRIGAAGKAPA